MQRTTVYWGENPSQLYMDAMLDLMVRGKEYAPRGKRIKELRPVVFEFHNPLNRVTFLEGRVINPFFQLAESWWILAGRSDVSWLTDYNKSIAQFSDNGVHFNAPYGERLRRWGQNNASGQIFGYIIDQLDDCYQKLKADPDTRQAVAFIGNPSFDNSDYTLKGGKDIACNLNIKFKIRDGKLDITVDNRSNDLHWGTFGANLCQFSTIQEAMASWLGIEVGVYYQETDSLHIYLDEYGAKETEKVLRAYGVEEGQRLPERISVDFYEFEDEPRFSSNYDRFRRVMGEYFSFIDTDMKADDTYQNDKHIRLISDIGGIKDDYIRLTLHAMMAYQAHKRGAFKSMVCALDSMPDCSWKVSCLRFLSKRYGAESEFTDLYKGLPEHIRNYIDRKPVYGG